MNDVQWLREQTSLTLSVTAVARVLGVDERTVNRAVANGQLPSIRVSSRILIPRLPLLAMLMPETPPAAPAPLSDEELDALAERVAERVIAKLASAITANAGAQTATSPPPRTRQQ